MENTEKRFLKVANYNLAIIIDLMKSILKEQGAEILEKGKKEYLYIPYTNEENKEKIKKVNALKPLKANSLYNSLYFVLDNYYYYIEYNDNPLFPIYFSKIKVNENGEYKGKRYLYSSEEINDREYKKTNKIAFSIAYDKLWTICTNEELLELAKDQLKQIEKWVINGAESERYRRRCRQYYDNNKYYYYATLYECSIINIYNSDSFYQHEKYEY